MIDLPKTRVGNLHDLCDWVELLALLDQAGSVSQDAVADVLMDAGLLGEAPEEYFPGDETFLSEDDMAPDDAPRGYAGELWGVLTARAARMGERYPFVIDGDLIRRRESSWSDTPSFTLMLLVANIARYDLAVELPQANGVSYRQLFERVVQAASQGLFKGSSVRFGTPRDHDWPVAIEERLQVLADRMGLRLETLQDKILPTDNDITVDVVSRMSFGDDGPGSVLLLTQCATGKHWKSKRGEPSLERWDLLYWQAHRVRGLAVPWWFEGAVEYDRVRRHFDGVVVLDRPRLLAGDPDQALDDHYRPIILEWCELQANQLPSL
jgi:hypothetical protein